MEQSTTRLRVGSPPSTVLFGGYSCQFWSSKIESTHTQIVIYAALINLLDSHWFVMCEEFAHLLVVCLGINIPQQLWRFPQVSGLGTEGPESFELSQWWNRFIHLGQPPTRGLNWYGWRG